MYWLDATHGNMLCNGNLVLNLKGRISLIFPTRPRTDREAAASPETPEMAAALLTCLSLSLHQAAHRVLPPRHLAPRCVISYGRPASTTESGSTAEEVLQQQEGLSINSDGQLVLHPTFGNNGGRGWHGGDDGGGGGGRDGDGSQGDDGQNEPLYNPLIAAWRMYSLALDTHPLVAKAVTAGCVGGLGDLFAQRLTGNERLDRQRLLAVVFDGMCISGPGLHMGYAWLERCIPCAGRGSLRNVLMQLLVDECIFDPLFIGAFFFSTGAIERQHPWRETLPSLRAQYWPTLKGAFATSVAFTPIQFVSFRYLPVKCRVLVVNVCDILWYAAVSLGRHGDRQGPEMAVA